MRRNSDKVRLDSWKSIANYLNRSVRTVRRWEANEDLPVHRHQHGKGSSVYAYQAELDAWRSNHHVPLSNVSDNNGHAIAAGRHKEKWVRYIAALGLIGAIVGVADMYFYSGGLSRTNGASVTEPSSPTVAAVYSPEEVARMLVSPVFSSWAAGHVQDAFRESQDVVQHLPKLPINVRENVSGYLIEFLVSLGRVADAKLLADGLTDGEVKIRLTDYILFAAGDMTRVISVLEAGGDSSDSSTAKSDVLAAMAAMQDGNIADAKKRLKVATGELDIRDQGYYFVALDLLAVALKSEGNLPGAVSVLETTMPKRVFASNNRSSIFWLMCQRNLAEFYREAGREADAVELENELRYWLRLADADFPIARHLAGV